MKEDRHIDELVAMHVFGWHCAHDIQPITRAMRTANARAEFLAKWGQVAPDGWRPDDMHKDGCTGCWCHSLPVAEQFSGSWCPKCGLTGDSLKSLPYYSYSLEYAWEVVEKMNGDGRSADAAWKRWDVQWATLARELFSMTARDAARAICLAALAAVGHAADAQQGDR